MHITKAHPQDDGPGAHHAPTIQAYGELHLAFELFNEELFRGKLPRCLITLQRSGRAYGHFCPGRFRSRDGRVCDEISLNPKYLGTHSFLDIASTLVHEMVHVWQEHFGRPSPWGYHNKEWAREMLSVGLHPSDTGKPGGRMTGRSMSDYVLAGGAFDIVARKIASLPLGVTWADARQVARSEIEPGEVMPATASGMRTKFTCPACWANAWGKSSLKLLCRPCGRPMLAPGESEGTPTLTTAASAGQLLISVNPDACEVSL